MEAILDQKIVSICRLQLPFLGLRIALNGKVSRDEYRVSQQAQPEG